jgi:hypothetical protein
MHAAEASAFVSLSCVMALQGSGTSVCWVVLTVIKKDAKQPQQLQMAVV